MKCHRSVRDGRGRQTLASTHCQRFKQAAAEPAGSTLKPVRIHDYRKLAPPRAYPRGYPPPLSRDPAGRVYTRKGTDEGARRPGNWADFETWGRPDTLTE